MRFFIVHSLSNDWSPVQTDATLLDVKCCARLQTLWYVVAFCWELLSKVWNRSNVWASNFQHFFCSAGSPKCSAAMLDPFAQLLQHCWGHARTLHMVSIFLWVVSFPRCTAGPNIVGSCCIRLHTTVNTEVTVPTIVDPTMLGVAASVCT